MESFVVHWGYLALFLLTALSAFGVPVGSELAMAYAGAIASGQLLSNSTVHFSLGVVIIIAICGEIAGSIVGYAFGRFGGRPIVDKVGRFILLTHRDLDRAEGFLAKRGEVFVLVGRLIPLLRSFIAIVAGLAEMAFWRFLVLTTIGSAIFTAAVCSIGYSLGHTWHKAVKDFSDVGYVAAGLAVIVLLIGIVHRIKVLREERAAV